MLRQKLKYYWLQLKSLFSEAAYPTEGRPLYMCTVFKNEAPFLKEWIDFHLRQGVKKFFLIDNFSTDDFKKILKPYRERGQVMLWQTQTSGMSGDIQSREMNRALKHISRIEGADCWVAFLDVDEYLFAAEPEKKIADFLDHFTQKKTAGILVNWLMFGTGGVKHLDPLQSMISQLRYRAKDRHREHRLFKTIVYLPNALAFVGGPHRPVAKRGGRFYYSDGIPFIPGEDHITHIPLRINHYWYRSEEYYRTEKKLKRRSFGDNRSKAIEEEHIRLCNEVEDETILSKE